MRSDSNQEYPQGYRGSNPSLSANLLQPLRDAAVVGAGAGVLFRVRHRTVLASRGRLTRVRRRRRRRSALRSGRRTALRRRRLARRSGSRSRGGGGLIDLLARLVRGRARHAAMMRARAPTGGLGRRAVLALHGRGRLLRFGFSTRRNEHERQRERERFREQPPQSSHRSPRFPRSCPVPLLATRHEEVCYRPTGRRAGDAPIPPGRASRDAAARALRPLKRAVSFCGRLGDPGQTRFVISVRFLSGRWTGDRATAGREPARPGREQR